MHGKKYTAEYKTKLVEQYLKENEENKVSIAQFALNNGISDSTFNDWVIKYKRLGNNFCNITNEIEKISDVQIIDYEKDIIKFPNEIEYKEKECRLIHKGIIIEFDEKLLERVLRVLKEW